MITFPVIAENVTIADTVEDTRRACHEIAELVTGESQRAQRGFRGLHFASQQGSDVDDRKGPQAASTSHQGVDIVIRERDAELQVTIDICNADRAHLGHKLPNASGEWTEVQDLRGDLGFGRDRHVGSALG